MRHLFFPCYVVPSAEETKYVSSRNLFKEFTIIFIIQNIWGDRRKCLSCTKIPSLLLHGIPKIVGKNCSLRYANVFLGSCIEQGGSLALISYT